MKILTTGLTVALAALMFLGGCRQEVKRAPVGDGVVTTGPRSCSKLGVCLKCGLGFDGHFSCGLKFSAFCPGTQTATVRETKVRITYDDGTFEDISAYQTLAASTCN
jgi:hypothetical protein